MTTIVYRFGVLAADTCITHDDHEPDVCTSRTYQCKLQSAWPGDRHGPRFYIASKGDADVGNELDALILKQCSTRYKTIVRNGLSGTLNSKAMLSARLKVIGDADYGAILVMFVWDNGDEKWYHHSVCEINSAGRLVGIDGEYLALGCDKAVALGALHSGSSAESAVRAAAAHGVYTAMPMHVVKVGESGRVLFQKVEK